MTLDYRDYTIESVPKLQTNGVKWQPHVVITAKNRRLRIVRSREFAGDALCTTKEEAEAQGIRLAKRIVDRVVEGESLAEIMATDRRYTPRYRVTFRTDISTSSAVNGTGVLVDLSMGGCRIETWTAVDRGSLLALQIHVPTLAWPLRIEAAMVQWVSGQFCGVAFVRIERYEQERLRGVIATLPEPTQTS